jgi:hypothetical protein
MRSRVLAWGTPLAALGLAAWDPARNGGPPLCPWRAITGTACPGCGLTRACGAFLRGRWDEAVQLHPLVWVVAVQVAVVWALVVASRRFGRLGRREPPAWVMPAVVTANALVFLGVWGVRLAAGTLPAA